MVLVRKATSRGRRPDVVAQGGVQKPYQSGHSRPIWCPSRRETFFYGEGRDQFTQCGGFTLMPSSDRRKQPDRAMTGCCSSI